MKKLIRHIVVRTKLALIVTAAMYSMLFLPLLEIFIGTAKTDAYRDALLRLFEKTISDNRKQSLW